MTILPASPPAIHPWGIPQIGDKGLSSGEGQALMITDNNT